MRMALDGPKCGGLAMNELWARFKTFAQKGGGLTTLLAVGLFVYAWVDTGPRFAFLMLATFSVLFISAWLFARLWLLLVQGKPFSRLDLVLLVLAIVGDAVVYGIGHPVMAVGMPVIGAILSLPFLIAAIRIRIALKNLRE
jgi:hypothetical protein